MCRILKSHVVLLNLLLEAKQLWCISTSRYMLILQVVFPIKGVRRHLTSDAVIEFVPLLKFDNWFRIFTPARHLLQIMS